MTVNQKTRKIKLILLILIVNRERARRSNFNFIELIDFCMEQVFWSVELKEVLFTMTFKKGLAVVGSNKSEQIITKRK